MLTLIVSTIAFFVAAYFVKRWLEGMDIPKGGTRSIVIIVVASAISYGVAYIVDLVSKLMS